MPALLHMHTQIINDIVGQMDSFLEEQVSRHIVYPNTKLEWVKW